MTNVVQVERVQNGYLVRVPAERIGGGVVAAERMYIALEAVDVATILEERVWPDGLPLDEEPAPAPPTVDDLEAAGVVKRGTDVAAAEEKPVERQPVADDGAEYPHVEHHGGRWTMECPVHGRSRAEFLGQVLRCVVKDKGQRCATSMPLEAAHRAAGLT